MSDEFNLEEGDRVLVKVRENSTSGAIQAKFVAEVLRFNEQKGMRSDQVVLDPPWRTITSVKLREHEAEFEKIPDDRTGIRKS